MSSITIIDRSAGQTILASFWQDLKSALGGDFMGRDVNGVPVSGNNCGTSAYPWGAGYFTQLVVGGVSFNNSTLERPPYQIVSGKVRPGSNQPAFLVAAGSAATFNLLASSTNLVLSINGVTSTWLSDVNSIPITAAPAANNTCLVNDATAASQAATKTWGEYGSGSPYYAITVNTMGSSISARVGSFQAFKVGTEYFIAYVESTTSLSRAFRGFFFDSTGAPLKRTTIANGATITLMNLGFVFADIDGVTVDTIFVGAGVNSAPTYAYTAPSSPATGDYWFDQGNQVWKSWSGAAWVIKSRILVGMVVADATNCKATRSGDFFGLCRADNTVELTWYSNTVLKGTGAFERVNVNGKNISFGNSLPVWDTASNLAAASDRYNAAVTASLTEYFYVTDTGDTKISDMEPYWRPDLLGWYHPFNPWRCVGSDLADGSAHFVAGTLSNPKIVERDISFPTNSVTSSSSGTGYSNATSSFTDVTNLSVTITTFGKRVELELFGDGSAGGSRVVVDSTGAIAGNCYLKFVRDSTDLSTLGVLAKATGVGGVSGEWPVSAFRETDTPPAGTYTYKVQAIGLLANNATIKVLGAKLRATTSR